LPAPTAASAGALIQIAWAKLRSLSEGAARASESLCMTG
jgi:hypothetical protein